MIEARGRTGRKPTAAEKGGSGGRTGTPGRSRASGDVKSKRYERPPTWKGAFTKSLIAAVVVYVVATLLLKRAVTANLLLLPLVLAIYTPTMYYTDMWMHRRYQRKKARG